MSIKTKKISKQKFLASSEYQEGVMDALAEAVNIYKNLKLPQKSEERVQSIALKIDDFFKLPAEYPKVVELSLLQIICNLCYSHTLSNLDVLVTIRKNLETVMDNQLSIRYQVLKRDAYRCVRCEGSPTTDQGKSLFIELVKSSGKKIKKSIADYETICKVCKSKPKFVSWNVQH
jgi:hypothetical protein